MSKRGRPAVDPENKRVHGIMTYFTKQEFEKHGRDNIAEALKQTAKKFRDDH